MKVWIVETGDYEQRGVWGVYSSPDVATERIKATYAPPYIVRWEDVRIEVDSFELVGHFDAVAGKSTRHTGVFDGRLFELDGSD